MIALLQSRRRRVAAAVLLLLVLAIVGWLWPRKVDLTSFDSKAIAASETRMWQAYYAKDTKALFEELKTALGEQFGLSQWTAQLVALELATGARNFAGERSGYEQNVLPHIEKAYARIRKATGGEFDPKEAARAELDWWVARRTPGQNSVEQVGRCISTLYAVLYGESNARIEEAGLLRASAAHVRDVSSDWPKSQELLEESYAVLLEGLRGVEDEAAE